MLKMYNPVVALSVYYLVLANLINHLKLIGCDSVYKALTFAVQFSNWYIKNFCCHFRTVYVNGLLSTI